MVTFCFEIVSYSCSVLVEQLLDTSVYDFRFIFIYSRSSTSSNLTQFMYLQLRALYKVFSTPHNLVVHTYVCICGSFKILYTEHVLRQWQNTTFPWLSFLQLLLWQIQLCKFHLSVHNDLGKPSYIAYTRSERTIISSKISMPVYIWLSTGPAILYHLLCILAMSWMKMQQFCLPSCHSLSVLWCVGKTVQHLQCPHA